MASALWSTPACWVGVLDEVHPRVEGLPEYDIIKDGFSPVVHSRLLGRSALVLDEVHPRVEGLPEYDIIKDGFSPVVHSRLLGRSAG